MNVIKKTIMAKSKKLSAKWTLEQASEVESVHDWDVEQELTHIIAAEIQEEIAAEIQEEIDWEILRKIAHESGWTEVEFTQSALDAGKEEIKAWATEQFDHGFIVHRDRIVFAKEEHAVLFALKWL